MVGSKDRKEQITQDGAMSKRKSRSISSFLKKTYSILEVGLFDI